MAATVIEGIRLEKDRERVRQRQIVTDEGIGGSCVLCI